jgi:hypothetical protein
MAVLPLKQTVTIKRKGDVDRWGNPIKPDKMINMKCRFEEGAKLTRRTAQQPGATQILSEEVVSSAQIYFDKFADVQLTDELIFKDESGNSRTFIPINIERIRGINGKAILTVVSV